MRGKQNGKKKRTRLRGITPADAGKTSLFVLRDNYSGNHPRRCGENMKTAATDFICLGSPPQMRGKPVQPAELCPHDRITPADAGKTKQYSCELSTARDHPRRCGENPVNNWQVCGVQGSPPQMRGKPSGKTPCWKDTGITPADAGKTTEYPAGSYACRDHPRRCGENSARKAEGFTKYGSPPQMRGKQRNFILHIGAARITPADAGKTCP